jgi:hypothetical protein
VFDQGGGEIGEHRTAVLFRDPEGPAVFLVAHGLRILDLGFPIEDCRLARGL